MQLPETSICQTSLAETPQQKIAFQENRRLVMPSIEFSDVQIWFDNLLEEMTGIQWVYCPNEYSTASLGLTAPTLGFADIVKYIVADQAVSLSASLGKSIKELSELTDGWDGGRAKPIRVDVLNDVVQFLKRLAQEPFYREPFIVPTFDGLVQMEWRGEKRLLEIEAAKEGWTIGGTLIRNDRQREDFEANCGRQDFQKLKTFY